MVLFSAFCSYNMSTASDHGLPGTANNNFRYQQATGAGAINVDSFLLSK